MKVKFLNLRIFLTAIFPFNLLLLASNCAAEAEAFQIELSEFQPEHPTRVIVQWDLLEGVLYKVIYAPKPYEGPHTINELVLYDQRAGSVFAELAPGSHFYAAMTGSSDDGETWGPISNVIEIDIDSAEEKGRVYHYSKDSWNTSRFELMASGAIFSGEGVDSGNLGELQILDLNFDGCDDFITDSGDKDYPGPPDVNGDRTFKNSAEWIRENDGYPIRIIMNDCDGHLTDMTPEMLPTSTPKSGLMFDPHTADINGDGWGEIFISDSGYETQGVYDAEWNSDLGYPMWPGGKTILVSNQYGEYLEDRTLFQNYDKRIFGHGLDVGDFNHDSILDVAFWNQGARYPNVQDEQIKHEIYKGNPNGTFELIESPGDDFVYKQPNAIELWSGTVEFIDMDQDGKQEFASSGGKSFIDSEGNRQEITATNFYRWDDDQGFQRFLSISDSPEYMENIGLCGTASKASTLRPLHLDNDGILDLAITYEHNCRYDSSETRGDARYRLLRSVGNYEFENAPLTLLPEPGLLYSRFNSDFTARDENADGLSELYTRERGNKSFYANYLKWSILDDGNYYQENLFVDEKLLSEKIQSLADGNECCFIYHWFQADGDDQIDLLILQNGTQNNQDMGTNYRMPYWIFRSI